jgi:hypothetical protein
MVHMQVNKAQYKEADCAKELKRGNIASFFSPSPKKKVKLETVKREGDAENASDSTAKNIDATKSAPAQKQEPLENKSPDAGLKEEECLLLNTK